MVEHAERARAPLERFEQTLRAISDRFPATPIRWSGASIEGEIVKRLSNKGIWIEFHAALNDKPRSPVSLA